MFTLLTTGSALNLSAAHRSEPTVYSDLVNRPLDPLFDAYTYTSGKQVNLKVDQIAALKELAPMDLLLSLEELLQRFLDLKQYPNLSFAVLCDNLTITLNEANLNIPDDRKALFEQIRANLEKLIADKRKCHTIISLRQEHPLCNQILIDTIQLALHFLCDNRGQLLNEAEISESDLNKIVSTLERQQRNISRYTRARKIISFNQLIDDVMKVSEEMNPIWDRVLQKNPNFADHITQKVEGLTRGKLDIAIILQRRISNI
jgi:hypothetical protein